MPVYEISSFRGGLSDYEDKGINGAFKFANNIDIRKRIDSLSCGQALTEEGLDSVHSPSASVSPSTSISLSSSPSPSASSSPTPSPSSSISPSLSLSLTPSTTESFSPSQSPSPSASPAITTIFEDLIHFFVKASDGYTYGFGNKGIIYRRDASGYWQRVYRDITAEESIALNYETGYDSNHTIGDVGGDEYWSAVRLDVTEKINCSAVSIYLVGKVGSPTGDMTFRIETDSGTKPLGKPSGTLVHVGSTGTIANASLTTAAWNKVTFTTQFTLAIGTYWLVVKVPDQITGTRWQWSRSDTGTGEGATSIDGGINWDIFPDARMGYYRLYESHLLGAIKGAAEKPTTSKNKYLYWTTNTTLKRKLIPGSMKGNEESVLANFETGYVSDYHALGDLGGVEYKNAVKFTTTKNNDFSAISIYLAGKAGSPTGDMTFRIESDNNGPSGILAHVSATGTIANASITTSAWNKCTFSSIFPLQEGTYWIVVSVPSQDSGVRWHWARYSLGTGATATSLNSGAWEVFTNARIPYFRVYKTDLAGFPNWNDVETVATNLEPADWHTIKQVGGSLMITNGDKLAMVGYDDSYTNEALDMIPGNIAKTIVERNGRSIIGTGLVSDPTKSINAAIDCEVPLAQVGDDGDLYFANMSDTIPAKRFPGGGKVNPGGVTNLVEEMNFFEWEQDSLSWIDKQTVGNLSLWAVWGADSGYMGIYSYGRKNKNHPFVMNLEYLTDDYDELGAITVVDGTILVSYQDGTEYGVLAVDPTTKAVGTYEGLDFKAPVKSPANITTWKYVELFMSPLPSGASVAFYYKVNKTGSWVQATLANGTTSYSVASGKKAVFNIGVEGEIYEPRVVMTPTLNSSPEIFRIRTYFI